MHHRLKRIAQSGALVGASCLTSHAAAQSVAATPTPGAPAHRWGDLGDPLSGYRLSAPIRLSLIGSIVPMASMFPQCTALEDASGNSVGGIPVQHYIDWRLAPRLDFSAFSSLGCPIDAGLGGALTYAVPLRRSLALVFAAGLYAAPGQTPFFGNVSASLLRGLRGGDTNVATDARADLVWQAPRGRSYNLGLESHGAGKQELKFGFSR
jgi:hypothetical protein